MTEKEELLELIAHKLYFVEQKPGYAAIAAINPLQFSDIAQSAVFGVKNLASATAQLPKESEMVLFQLPGKTLSDIVSCLPNLMALEGLNETLAAVNGRLILLDDVRFQAADEVQQLEIMAEVFYPKFFAFGHEGSAWAKLNL